MFILNKYICIYLNQYSFSRRNERPKATRSESRFFCTDEAKWIAYAYLRSVFTAKWCFHDQIVFSRPNGCANATRFHVLVFFHAQMVFSRTHTACRHVTNITGTNLRLAFHGHLVFHGHSVSGKVIWSNDLWTSKLRSNRPLGFFLLRTIPNCFELSQRTQKYLQTVPNGSGVSVPLKIVLDGSCGDGPVVSRVLALILLFTGPVRRSHSAPATATSRCGFIPLRSWGVAAAFDDIGINPLDFSN